MKTGISRLGFVMAALLVAIVLVVFLTFVGDRSLGPIEDLFHKTGTMISSVESRVVIKNRKHTRSSELKWLVPYRHSREKLLRPEMILLGAYDNETTESYASILELEQSIDTVLPIIHIYTAWGDHPDERFPAEHVQAIIDLGSIPFITWEPWLTDFDQEQHEELPEKADRDKHGMASVAAGMYDFYLARWAEDVKSVDSEIFVRLGHEMNDAYRYPWGPQNNTPEEFISAWRHVYDFFKAAGVKNIVWVWSPHPAYKRFDEYYPGDAYVDWIGIGTLNYGDVAPWSQWWTFDEIFGTYYPDLEKYNKPIMLTEFASLPVGGDRPEWYREALQPLPRKYPLVRGLMFFHFSNDNSTTYKALNWYIKDDSLTTNAITGAIRSWPHELQALPVTPQ